MKFEFILLLFLAINVDAQNATFKEIKLRAKPEFFNPKKPYATIFYPTISIKNIKANKLINDEIKKQVLDTDEDNSDVKKELNISRNDGLVDLSYQVTFNKNYILSLNIYTQYNIDGNHLSDNTIYFNFDLKTGKQLSLSDLLIQNKIDSFKNKVLLDSQDSLSKYRDVELNMLKQKEIDSATYELVIEQIGNYNLSSEEYESFMIDESSIEIIDQIGFPRVIRYLEPSYHLKYFFKRIAAFLNPKYRNLLLK